MTEDDAYRTCEKERVEIFWSKERFPFYFTVPDDDLRIIVMPQRLSGIELRFAFYHELSHHFLHGGDEPCVAFYGGRDKKCEAEADAVALIALFPTLNDSPLFCNEFTQELWAARLRLQQYFDG